MPSICIISPAWKFPSTEYKVAWSPVDAATTYPLAPDVTPVTTDPRPTVWALAKSRIVNIWTSKRFNLYLSSASPKVVLGSAKCSKEETRAYPITLPTASPGVVVNLSWSSIVWYELVIVEPDTFTKPNTFWTKEKLPNSNGMIVFCAASVSLGLARSTYFGVKVLILYPLT